MCLPPEFRGDPLLVAHMNTPSRLSKVTLTLTLILILTRTRTRTRTLILNLTLNLNLTLHLTLTLTLTRTLTRTLILTLSKEFALHKQGGGSLSDFEFYPNQEGGGGLGGLGIGAESPFRRRNTSRHHNPPSTTPSGGNTHGPNSETHNTYMSRSQYIGELMISRLIKILHLALDTFELPRAPDAPLDDGTDAPPPPNGNGNGEAGNRMGMVRVLAQSVTVEDKSTMNPSRSSLGAGVWAGEEASATGLPGSQRRQTVSAASASASSHQSGSGTRALGMLHSLDQQMRTRKTTVARKSMQGGNGTGIVRTSSKDNAANRQWYQHVQQQIASNR